MNRNKGYLLVTLCCFLTALLWVIPLITHTLRLYSRSIDHRVGYLSAFASSVSSLRLADYYWSDIPFFELDDDNPDILRSLYLNGFQVPLFDHSTYLLKSLDYVYSISVYTSYRCILRSPYSQAHEAVILSGYEPIHLALDK